MTYRQDRFPARRHTVPGRSPKIRGSRRGGGALGCLVLVPALSLMAGLIGAPASSCTMKVGAGKWLVDDGQALPANAVGIPAQGWRPPETSWEAFAEQFQVEELSGDEPTVVDFSLRPLDFSAYRPRHAGMDRFFMVVPSGFAAGKAYRLTRFASSSNHDSRVTVQVGELPLPEHLVMRVRRTESWGSLPDIPFLTACDQAHQVRLGLDLPEAFRAYRDALFYFSYAHGEPWEPRGRSRCSGPRLGRSRQDVGEDLFYSSCRHRHFEGGNGDGVPPGEQEVRLVAWLPGTDWDFETEQKVVFACPWKVRKAVNLCLDKSPAYAGAPRAR